MGPFVQITKPTTAIYSKPKASQTFELLSDVGET